METLTVQQLIDAGVHFGCRVARWNPKMAPFIHGRRSQIHLIELRETLKGLIRAQNFLYHTVAEGSQILWVGTKRQIKGVIAEAGERTGMPVVTERWIGGTLTNFSVIRSRLRRLEELESLEENGASGQYSKKVLSSLRREKRKITRNLAGIREMVTIPGAIVIVDPSREDNAVREARKMGLVVIGILDTDCDPEGIDVVIPGNDDALRSVRLLVETLVKAVEEGAATHRERMAATGAAERTENQPMSDEPRPTRQRTLPRPVRAMPGLGSLEETGLDEGEPEHRGGPRVSAPEPAEAPRE
jgi:small subunit ribosomal protein S2